MSPWTPITLAHRALDAGRRLGALLHGEDAERLAEARRQLADALDREEYLRACLGDKRARAVLAEQERDEWHEKAIAERTLKGEAEGARFLAEHKAATVEAEATDLRDRLTRAEADRDDLKRRVENDGDSIMNFDRELVRACNERDEARRVAEEQRDLADAADRERVRDLTHRTGWASSAVHVPTVLPWEQSSEPAKPEQQHTTADFVRFVQANADAISPGIDEMRANLAAIRGDDPDECEDCEPALTECEACGDTRIDGGGPGRLAHPSTGPSEAEPCPACDPRPLVRPSRVITGEAAITAALREAERRGQRVRITWHPDCLETWPLGEDGSDAGRWAIVEGVPAENARGELRWELDDRYSYYFDVGTEPRNAMPSIIAVEVLDQPPPTWVRKPVTDQWRTCNRWVEARTLSGWTVGDIAHVDGERVAALSRPLPEVKP